MRGLGEQIAVRFRRLKSCAAEAGCGDMTREKIDASERGKGGGSGWKFKAIF
jgi:hypothetical protein